MLKINEIQETISGEIGRFPAGSYITLIRLQGCNLHCRWCDAPDARQNLPCIGMEVNEVLSIIREINNNRILITGGEPLLQRDNLLSLILPLLRREYQVQIETNGSILLPDETQLKSNITWVVDRKMPSSDILLSKCMSRDELVWYVINSNPGEILLKYVVADEPDIKLAVLDIVTLLRKMDNITEGQNYMFKLFQYPAPIFWLSPVIETGKDTPIQAQINPLIDQINQQIAKENLKNYAGISVQIHKVIGMP